MEHKYISNDTKLIINDNVIYRLSMFKQSSSVRPESGGLLIGRTDINGKTRIFEITEPMENDISNRITFKRRDKGHLQILAQANKRCLYFKGNWHTHPQKKPAPSCIDKISWRRAINQSKPGESNYIFFLIVGTEEIKVWYGNMKTHLIHEMEYLK